METVSQKSDSQDQLIESLLSYWKKQLLNAPPLLELPTDHPRQLQTSYKAAHLTFPLSKSCADALTKLSLQYNAKLNMILLAAFNILLSRYSNQKDIVIGYQTSGINKSKPENPVSGQTNIILLRTDLSGNPSFLELLSIVSEAALHASGYDDVPFEILEEALKKGKSSLHSQLFQVMFAFRTGSETGMDIPAGSNGKINTPSDITLSVEHNTQGLTEVWEYNAGLFNEATIGRMAQQFKVLLNGIITNPKEKIFQLPILTQVEVKQLLQDFNNTTMPYPNDKSIVDLFEEQVAATPHHPAVVFEEQELTYGQLNARANQLAHYLRSRGVKEETPVPICIDRSLEMIVGIVGILKAGAAYVPLDPQYPAERISHMLEDIKASIVISSKDSRKNLQATGIETIELDGGWSAVRDQQPVSNLAQRPAPGQLAYIIYTSGSTGRPKGVKMAGSSLVNLLIWQQKQFINKQRHVLQFASLNFDVSFQDIFSTICFGSTLYLISSDRRIDMAEVVNDIQKNNITHLFIPYIVLKNLAEHILQKHSASFPLEEIIVAGEQLKLTEDIQALVKKSGIRLINQYGPTETHVVSSYEIISTAELPTLPPIGKPIDNTRLYIVSDAEQLVPVGVTGELWIGGVQVAQGYLNQPELTTEKFVKDLFFQEAGARLYKTGDLARWLPDGNIEYLGRSDQQFKIRGYRVELGEIETVLMQSNLFRQVAVIAKEDTNGNKRLIGYTVPKGSIDREAIIDYLKTRLPEYMVPLLWMKLESLPLTPNGKVDRASLPFPEQQPSKMKKIRAAPRDALEYTLKKIWEDCLKIYSIGVLDNFFELGGNSVQAAQMFSKIRKNLGKQLPLAILFQAPTIEQLAVFVRGEGGATHWSSLVPIQPNGSRPPLFCMHAGAGTVLLYKTLSVHLGSDQPVYGLQAKGLNGNEPPHSRIEDMAAHYINEIRTIQSEGPYFLAGYCLGGILAFEMAQQLSHQNQKVALLVSINGVSPTYTHPPHLVEVEEENDFENSPNTFSNKISDHWKKFRALSTEEKIIYPFQILFRNLLSYNQQYKMRKIFYKFYISRNRPLPETLGKTYFLETNADIAKAYKPKPYPGRMIIFRSPGIYPDPFLGWDGLSTGGIESCDILGNHQNRRDIVNEPFVQRTAEELNNYLGNRDNNIKSKVM